VKESVKIRCWGDKERTYSGFPGTGFSMTGLSGSFDGADSTTAEVDGMFGRNEGSSFAEYSLARARADSFAMMVSCFGGVWGGSEGAAGFFVGAVRDDVGFDGDFAEMCSASDLSPVFAGLLCLPVYRVFLLGNGGGVPNVPSIVSSDQLLALPSSRSKSAGHPTSSKSDFVPSLELERKVCGAGLRASWRTRVRSVECVEEMLVRVWNHFSRRGMSFVVFKVRIWLKGAECES
jgi:hypothetical protein